MTQTFSETRFGAFSYGFCPDQLDALIERFHSMGLTGVQWGSDLLDDSLRHPETIPKTVERLSDAGIEIVGLAGYRNLVAPDESRRNGNLDYLKRCLEFAPHLGRPIVATETGTLNPSDWQPDPGNRTAAAQDRFYQALEELLPVAEAHGSVLALEPYVNNVIGTLEQVADVMERYPTPGLGLILDPYNLISSDLLPEAASVCAEFCERWRDRFAIAHLKDVSAEGAEIDTPAFGDGVFPHAGFARFLRERRPDLVVVLEHIDLDRIPGAIEAYLALEQPPTSP